jgi:putative ABC transport system ATP-binding protein
MNQPSCPSPPVVVENLTMDYGSSSRPIHALRDVSLAVERGQLVAIIGASGSGKSTLLHLIAGLARPTAGTVHIDGYALADMSDRALTLFRRRHIGLIFQAFNLVPTLSVQDNCQLPLLMRRRGAADPQRIDALLATLGLSERQRHRPDQLSGGEQQRVAIGRALVNDPSVILADEPTGNLDSVNSRKLCELIRRLCDAEQRTILMVTHDPAVAMWADRVLVLRDGHLIGELNPAEFDHAGALGARVFDLMSALAPEAVPCG